MVGKLGLVEIRLNKLRLCWLMYDMTRFKLRGGNLQK